jgi:hypothetical protein
VVQADPDAVLDLESRHVSDRGVVVDAGVTRLADVEVRVVRARRE